MATPDDTWAEAQEELTARVSALTREPYLRLGQLPAHRTQESGGVSYTTYRERLDDGRLQIVVQASMPRGKLLLLFPVSSVLARGFRVSGDGQLEEMAESDLYDFM